MNQYQAPLFYTPPADLPFPEASGAAAGGPQDASVGMQHLTANDGSAWAWNPVMGEWQACHEIVSGDTLFKLSGVYYGSSSLDGVHAIYDVPQNKAIQGPSPDSGLIPGDVILIPGLPQPATAPEASDTVPSSLPDLPPTGSTVSTIPGTSIPGVVASGAPAGWPSDESYPPVNMPNTAPGQPIVLPTIDVTGDSNDGMQPVGTSSSSKPPFWNAKTIAIAAGGTLALGSLLYLATRKKRRRRAA